MPLGRSFCRQMDDCASTRGQGVGDHPAVAAPPNGLGAHERGGHVGRSLDQAPDCPVEFLGVHVVRVASKGRRSQGHVRGVRTRLTPPSEVLSPHVLDPLGEQAGLELLLAELGVLPRSGSGSHVCHAADASILQYGQELLDRPGPVSSREDGRSGRGLPRHVRRADPYDVALRKARVAPVSVKSPTRAMIPSALPSSIHAYPKFMNCRAVLMT